MPVVDLTMLDHVDLHLDHLDCPDRETPGILEEVWEVHHLPAAPIEFPVWLDHTSSTYQWQGPWFSANQLVFGSRRRNCFSWFASLDLVEASPCDSVTAVHPQPHVPVDEASALLEQVLISWNLQM